MSIYKFLITTTLVFVSALFIGGVYYPESFAMILADTTMSFAILRAILCILLIILLVTNPPRSLAIRTAVGTSALFLVVVTLQLLLNFQMHLLDAVVFMQVAIIFGIEALETRNTPIPVREKRTAIHKTRVLTN